MLTSFPPQEKQETPLRPPAPSAVQIQVDIGRASRPCSVFLFPLAVGFRHHLPSGLTSSRHPPNPPVPFRMAKPKLPRYRQRMSVSPRSVDVRVYAGLVASNQP